MSRRGVASESDLLPASRNAASELSSHATSSGRRRHRHSRSEADLRSGVTSHSRRSRGSRSSYRSEEEGMTLADMQNHVGNKLMDRYIENLQKEAKDAVKETEYWSRKIADDQEEERQERQRKRNQAARNQFELQQQIEENKMRRAEDRREFIEAASSHSFPLFTETFISLEEVNEKIRNQKKDFRESIFDQLASLDRIKKQQKKEDMDYAESNRAKNEAFMKREKRMERDRLAKQGRDLVNSWDRELRLQHIKKAIHSGKDVVRQTLGPGAVQPVSSPSGSRRS